MKKSVTKAQAKKAATVVSTYAKQEANKAYSNGKTHSKTAVAAVKVGISKLKGLFK